MKASIKIASDFLNPLNIGPNEIILVNVYTNTVIMLKKTWDIIKEVIGSSRPSSHTLPRRIIVNDIEITEKNKIAEQFNKYFVNVGPKLASSIPRSNIKAESFFSGNYPTLNENPLTVNEIKDAFSKLKSNKSPGFDDISSDVVKFVIDALFNAYLIFC